MGRKTLIVEQSLGWKMGRVRSFGWIRGVGKNPLVRLPHVVLYKMV